VAGGLDLAVGRADGVVVRLLVVALVLAMLAAACAPGGVPAGEKPPATEDPVFQESTRETTPAAVEVSAPPRLASHLFVPVGAARSIAGLGELLEVIPFTGRVSVDGDEVRAAGSGISCLRFRYRDVPDENAVQTMCVVAFDETGDCAGFEPLGLDLNVFLDPSSAPVGNADLLTSGSLYAACRTPEGAFRLQQPDVDLPPLYFVVVDALGGGAYSLGDDELPAQRNGVVTTFRGEELRPPWIVSVSREVSDVELTPVGRFILNDEDCALVPSCSDDPSVVQPGDVLRFSIGMSPEQLEEVMESADPRVLDAFVRDRIGVSWEDVRAVHPDAVFRTFARLAVADIMGDLLLEWDARYGLREKEVIVGYVQPWFAEWELTRYCYPDAVEQAECERIEAAIAAYETGRIAAASDAGFTMWQGAYLNPDPATGGASERRPRWSAFDGVIAGIGATDADALDLPRRYRDAVRSFATEVGSETPVLLVLEGPPIAAQTGGPPCEADICPSDFQGAYSMAEAALAAALDVLSPGQLRGFGAATFEGAHFDIREPYEDFGAFSLNRVGETGYNHPILNAWRAS
jgi:hypothetical protein